MTREAMRPLTAAVLLLIGTLLLAAMSHFSQSDRIDPIETAQAGASAQSLPLPALRAH